MVDCDQYSAKGCDRFPKYAELSENRGSIIEYFLAKNPVFRVEREDAAQWKTERPAGGWQASPGTGMRAVDDGVQYYPLDGDVAVDHIDPEVARGGHQLFIVGLNMVAPDAMIVPRLIIVAGVGAERAENSLEIM